MCQSWLPSKGCPNKATAKPSQTPQPRKGLIVLTPLHFDSLSFRPGSDFRAHPSEHLDILSFIDMSRKRASYLTSLPYDILNQILNLAIPPLPQAVHLSSFPCASYLKLFRPFEATPCLPILLVCRLLTRHLLRMIYSEVRIVIHLDRGYLTALTRLKSRQHVQHIDLAVNLQPGQVQPCGHRAGTKPTHVEPYHVVSFYSPSYVVDLVLRTFPILKSVQLTIVESGAEHKSGRDACDVVHSFAPSSLTDTTMVDSPQWNERITSLRYKLIRSFITLTEEDLRPKTSPKPGSFAFPPVRPGNDRLTDNEQWRDRTRRLMQIAARSPGTPLYQPCPPIVDKSGPPNEAEPDTDDSVTDFILQDELPTEQEDETEASPGTRPQLPSFVFPPRNNDGEIEDLLHTHLLARFRPFSPPILPNLQTISF